MNKNLKNHIYRINHQNSDMVMNPQEKNNKVDVSVRDLILSFGGLSVLFEISFEILEGELLALIGPNGAGKTSLINCLTGFYHPQAGKILFRSRDITDFSSVKRSKMGISRTFQNIELYNSLTVMDNLMAGRHNHMSYGFLSAGFYFGRARKQEIEQIEKVEDIIDLLELESFRNSTVGSLAYGIRKRVDLGRALALEPKLLLLDEPMAGMNTEEKEDMARFILDIQELWKTTILLIEHDMGVVMDISDRVVALDFGRKIAEGTPEQIRNNPKVINAYLGSEQ